MTYSRDELEQQWRPMVRAATRLLGCPHEAEECAATAILQVLEREPAIDNLEAFMVAVAQRRAIDRLRSLERSRIRDRRLAMINWHPEADVAEDVTSRAEARWLRDQAQRRLTPQSWRILTAVADGEDLQRVASRENMTRRAAESDLFRTRRLLRAVWARTLAAASATWVITRRGIAVSVPAVAVAFVVFATPSGPAETIRLPGSEIDSIGQSPPSPRPGRTSTPALAAKSAPAPIHSALRSSQSSTAHSAARRILQSNDPAGSTTVSRETHGQGSNTSGAEAVLECVENLDVSPPPDLHRLGC